MSTPVSEQPPTIGEALRGMWAVVWLVLTAVWELATAALNIRPSFLPVLRRLGHAVAEAYRAGCWGEASVLDPDIDVEP